MLILPLPRAPDWRKPPVMTMLLILICSLVFFVIQGRDDAYSQAAWTFYLKSSLPAIEQPLYQDWLQKNGRSSSVPTPAELRTPRGRVHFAMQLEADSAFLAELKNGLLRPRQEIWASERLRFEHLQQKPISSRYGFSTADPQAITWLTHMFLHGSEDHLLGNMVVLFVVGYLVEEVLGAGVFLLLYLLAGCGSAAFDLYLNAGRAAVGIGASGAISGIMAIFVGLFRLQRIRFFYWILFYADFIKAPALLVLPLWIGNEVYQLWAHPESHINYAAHIGGFISGSVLAAIWLLLSRQKVSASMTMAPEVDPLRAEMDGVQKLISALKIDQALPLLQDLGRRYPDNLQILSNYYHLSKLQPASAHFHRAAALLLALPDSKAHDSHPIFTEYLRLAQPGPTLAPDLQVELARRLLRAGHLDDAERLVRALNASSATHPALPGLLLLQARVFHRRGDTLRLQQKLQALIQTYPLSEEAAQARQLQ